MPHAWSTTTTAFTVTRRGSEWLMLRHTRLGVTSWELPGGHVDPGETLEQAAARETVEETGVSVQVGRMLALCVHEWPERRQRKAIGFFDAVPLESDRPVEPADEPDIEQVSWVDPLTLVPEDVSPFLHPLVEQQRLGWPVTPFTYAMTHRRSREGLWVPAPA